VRYLYDEKTGRRLKTVELVVESIPWRPRARRPRRRDDEIVAVQIAFHETELSGYPPLDICRHIGPSTYRCLHPRIDGSSIAAMQFNH